MVYCSKQQAELRGALRDNMVGVEVTGRLVWHGLGDGGGTFGVGVLTFCGGLESEQ